MRSNHAERDLRRWRRRSGRFLACCLAMTICCAVGCADDAAVPTVQLPSDTVSEIPGAPEHVWFEDYSDGVIGDPHRAAGRDSLGWVSVRQTAVGAEYVECNPIDGLDRQVTTQRAGYVVEGVKQVVDGRTWTRYRKLALEETLRRRVHSR